MRRLLQTCCVFLLLFAQQAALTHVLWHAHRAPPAERVGAASIESKRYAGAKHVSILCSLHALLGQVLGAAACEARRQSRTFVAHEKPQPHAADVIRREFLTPLSRGPPSPLAV